MLLIALWQFAYLVVAIRRFYLAAGRWRGRLLSPAAAMLIYVVNRFTLRALRVLFYARSEVSQLGSGALEPEHIRTKATGLAAGSSRELVAPAHEKTDFLGDSSRQTPQRLPTAQARPAADGSRRCRSRSTCLSHSPMRFQLVKTRVTSPDRIS